MGALWDSILAVNIMDQEIMDGPSRLGMLQEFIQCVLPTFVRLKGFDTSIKLIFQPCLIPSVVVKDFRFSVHQVNSNPALHIIKKNYVVFSMSNGLGCGRSPDIAVDEFTKLSSSFSSPGGWDWLSLHLSQKTGLTGSSRFVS